MKLTSVSLYNYCAAGVTGKVGSNFAQMSYLRHGYLDIPNNAFVAGWTKEPHQYSQLLRCSKTHVEDGYGEYLVFDKSGNPVTNLSTYEKVFNVLEKYRVRPGSQPERATSLQIDIQKIDPEFKVAFVPRTLYELFFRHRAAAWGCVQREDLHGYKTVRLALKMNESMVRKFHPTGFFTGTEISEAIELELRQQDPEFRPSSRLSDIVRKACDIECSSESQNALLIYRGGDLKPLANQYSSICFGVGLFGSFINDKTASPLHYMASRPSWVIQIPADSNNIPYYIPNWAHALWYNYAMGEYHHARTLVTKSALDNPEKLQGFGGTNYGSSFRFPEAAFTEQSFEKISNRLNDIQKNAISLEPHYDPLSYQ